MPAPGGVQAPPGFVGARPTPLPSPLRLPLGALGADGVVDLGADGKALLARASSVSFSLRTPVEQEALVAGFARWLNSLSEPVQLLVRAEPVELAPMAAALLEAAPGLPHPALEEAARDHARFLEELGRGRALLRREVLVVFREPPAAGAPERLARRAEEAVAALAAAGVALAVLDGAEAGACLARAADPGAPSLPTGLAAPGEVVKGAAPVRAKLGLGRGTKAWPPATSGPEAVEVRPRSLRLGDDWCASFCVVGYPREVGLGWLEPLTTHPGRLDVSLHVEPVAPAVAAERLRRQLARLDSGRRSDAARGRLADPEVEVAALDARELAAGLARGEQKLFRAGLCLTVHAPSEAALASECARVRSLCASLLLDAQPATWRSLQGWASTLPLGVDALEARPASTPPPLRQPSPSPRRSCRRAAGSSTARPPRGRAWSAGTASPATTTTR